KIAQEIIAGNPDELVSLLEKNIGNNKNYNEVWELLGDIFDSHSRVEKAIELYEKVIKIKPSKQLRDKYDKLCAIRDKKKLEEEVKNLSMENERIKHILFEKDSEIILKAPEVLD